MYSYTKRYKKYLFLCLYKYTFYRCIFGNNHCNFTGIYFRSQQERVLQIKKDFRICYFITWCTYIIIFCHLVTNCLQL